MQTARGLVASLLLGCGLALLPPGSHAATYYVWTNSPADGPGTAWTNAFHTLQAAVDAAASNDTVLVTNGVYDSGGVALVGTMTNRAKRERRVWQEVLVSLWPFPPAMLLGSR